MSILPELTAPPPLAVAWLPLIAPPVMVNRPPAALYTPPPYLAWFSVMLPLSSVRVPLLRMPPPFPLVRPPVIAPPPTLSRTVSSPWLTITLPFAAEAIRPRLSVHPFRSMVTVFPEGMVSAVWPLPAVISQGITMAAPFSAPSISACSQAQSVSSAIAPPHSSSAVHSAQSRQSRVFFIHRILLAVFWCRRILPPYPP